MKRPLYYWMWVAVAVVCFVLIMQLAPTDVWTVVIDVTVALVSAVILTATLNAEGTAVAPLAGHLIGQRARPPDGRSHH